MADRRRLPLFTPSGATRALACTAVSVLPHGEDAGSEARELGSAFHRFVQRIPLVGHDAALALVPADAPERALCEAFDPEAHGIDWASAEAEVAYAFDLGWGLGRRLVDAEGRPIADREYERAHPPLEDDEIPGSVDLIDRHLGEWRVTDWKTGRNAESHELQLDVYGLAIVKAHGLPGIWERIVYVGDGAKAHAVEWYRTADELEAVADRLRDGRTAILAARERYARGEDYQESPGPHCRYCPAAESCRAPAVALSDLATKYAPRAQIERALRTPEGFAHWFDRYTRAKSVLESLGTKLHEAAEAFGPIALPDGRVVKVVDEPRRSVTDEAAALAVLAEQFGPEAAEGAVKVTRSVTLRAIEKVAQAHAEKGDKRAAAERVLDEIERRGGIRTKNTPRLEVKAS
jgi:hypothetical protein